MPDFVPHGYMSLREALNQLGREYFPAEWNGEEYKARTGLMTPDEMSKPGTGASGSWRGSRGRVMPSNTPVPSVTAQIGSTANSPSSSDPSSAGYQEERKAAERFETVRNHLRVLLERGELQAVIMDPWSGVLHPVPDRMWRVSGADRMIKAGRAQIPPSGNDGPLLVKAFFRKGERPAPLPYAKIEEAVVALVEKTAKESLTRQQQGEFVRKLFPGHHVTERQLQQIYQKVPTQTGRPAKSNKKV